ncbi:MAG: hypothetical protein Q7R96_05195 [Nanoarchaeota archaeon]|nr:hypothetical protein [Nanoarchaeota archaeon]
MDIESKFQKVLSGVLAHKEALESEAETLRGSTRELQEKVLERESEAEKRGRLAHKLGEQKKRFDDLMRLTDDEIRLMNLLYTKGIHVYSGTNKNPFNYERGKRTDYLGRLTPQADLGILGERIDAIMAYGFRIDRIALEVRTEYLNQEPEERSQKPMMPQDLDLQTKECVEEVLESPHFENVRDTLFFVVKDLRNQVILRTMPEKRSDYLMQTPPEEVFKKLVERTKRHQKNIPTWICPNLDEIETYNSRLAGFENPAITQRKNLKWIIGEIETEK